MVQARVNRETNIEMFGDANSDLLYDRKFRARLFRTSLKGLPVEIFIDERKRGYHIQDNTLKIIWADDLPGGDAQTIIHDLMRQFPMEDWSHMIHAFSPDGIEEAFKKKKDIKLLSHFNCPNHKAAIPVQVTLHFSTSGNGKVYSFYIKEHFA